MRLRALLVHGMGGDQTWWDPFLPVLGELNVTPVPLKMPDLETCGPERWVEFIGEQRDGGTPLLLIGFSLGAAAALKAAATFRMTGVILCAVPSVSDGSIPAIPSSSHLSVTAMARVALFLKDVSRLPVPDFITDRFYISGGNDPWTCSGKWIREGFTCREVPDCDHELNRSVNGRNILAECIVSSKIARSTLDPGRRFLWNGVENGIQPLGLSEYAPPPARCDIEITSRCQLQCRFCARTLYDRSTGGIDMTTERFERVLDSCADCNEMIFVGLGEPLLHPDCASFVARAHARGMRTLVVTNGVSCSDDAALKLKQAGCDELTFSIDAVDEKLFGKLRGGASFETVRRHLTNAKKQLPVSVFTALSKDNIAVLPDMVDVIESLQLPALTVTGLNFPENRSSSCDRDSAGPYVDDAISRAHDAGILLLGPHIHDFPGVKSALRHCMITCCEDITGNPSRHTNCLAPWRIAVVDAEGNVSPCNCAPKIMAGNVTREPFEAIWNGPVMRKWRSDLLNDRNGHCESCPRY